jgi:hypothetical protein
MSFNDLHICHVTLNTGHERTSYRHEVSAEVIRVCGDLLDAALEQRGRRVPVPVPPDSPKCSLSATAEGRCAIFTVWGPNGESLVTFGVAPPSPCAKRLWQLLHQSGSFLEMKTSPARVPVDSWCAARVEVGFALYPPQAGSWIGDFERCIAWAWLSRKGEGNIQ